MTRRKGILRILIVLLAVLLLAVPFAGCGEYTPPTGSNGGSVVDPNPPPVDETDPDDYTATLTHYDGTPFTSSDYGRITRLQAQWTEANSSRPAVYRAYFNEKGVANAGKLDGGPYNVTLVLTDDFKNVYAYDPNPSNEKRRDELKATDAKKGVKVPLYQIKEFGKETEIYVNNFREDGSSVTETRKYHLIRETGAYKWTLQSRDDRHMFGYSPRKAGVYAFMTMMDVTADEINPLADMYIGNTASKNFYPADFEYLDASAGNYTKNIWIEYSLSDGEVGGGSHGNAMVFDLYSESEKPNAYPLTIYFIFEKDREFTEASIERESVPVTENFKNTPEKPDGTLVFVGARDPVTGIANERHILDETKVRYNNPRTGGDGYYYYLNPETNDFFREEDGSVSAQYRLYAAISAPNPVLASATPENPAGATLTNGQLTSQYYWVVGEDGTTKDYYDFIMGANGYAAHCDGGYYPVTAELQQFLQDWAISQRYFNDGNGFAEGSGPLDPGYNSDEDSQWLFACCVHMPN
ncbi:MAG: hypothetical protein NC033_00375 [Clostridiales bacterium]|nr:hypothetical protein [Clostridiales bacterium]